MENNKNEMTTFNQLPSNILVVPSEKYMEMFNLDVSDYLDFKGGSGGKKFAYLSWAWAWVLLRKNFPTLVPTYIPAPSGECYWIDTYTLEAYIKPILVDSESGAQSIPFDFPIMDFRNQAIKALEKKETVHEDGTVSTELVLATVGGKPALDRMSIEKNVQRALVKAIAKTTGIGIRLWNDEDINGEQRSQYLQKLDPLLGLYQEKYNTPHPQKNAIYSMTNKELISLGKELKGLVSSEKALDGNSSPYPQ